MVERTLGREQACDSKLPVALVNGHISVLSTFHGSMLSSSILGNSIKGCQKYEDVLLQYLRQCTKIDLFA